MQDGPVCMLSEVCDLHVDNLLAPIHKLWHVVYVQVSSPCAVQVSGVVAL